MPASAGADSVARTIYAAVTGRPMPSTSEARPIRTMAISRLPPAQLAIIRLNVLPTPAVAMTLTTRPTAQSSTADVIMLRAPISSASITARTFGQPA